MTSPGNKPATIRDTAFSCPHCNALAKQFWFSTLAQELSSDRPPINFTTEEAENFVADLDEGETKTSLRAWARRVSQQLPFFEAKKSDPYAFPINNLSVSRCFNCHDIAIWIGSRLVYPASEGAVPPNADLSADVRRDYSEAASILNLSPRGATALLRLAIQKICIELGGDGKNLNDDIALLVSKGLDSRVQQALDVVRVIGNGAVHPGILDLRDDKRTAEQLFGLVNLIAEVMISQPKHIGAMYAALPDGAKKAVQFRDEK